MHAALFSYPLFDDYFEIKLKTNRPEYFKGVLSAQAGMMNEGLKRSGQWRSVFFTRVCFLLVYISPDRPAMKAAASGHDGSLQGSPTNLKYKNWTVL